MSAVTHLRMEETTKSVDPEQMMIRSPIFNAVIASVIVAELGGVAVRLAGGW
jgi:hypothetical protein